MYTSIPWSCDITKSNFTYPLCFDSDNDSVTVSSTYANEYFVILPIELFNSVEYVSWCLHRLFKLKWHQTFKTPSKRLS
jgi:hypothetical protein